MPENDRPPRPELITFDLGNVLTLVDERPAIRELARLSNRDEQAVFDACYSPAAKRVLETGQVTWREFVARVERTLGFRLAFERFLEIFESSLTPNRPIFGLVEAVAARYRVALCSNTSEPHWLLEKGRLPFGRRFDPAIVSYEIGVMKPDREIYDAISDRSGIPHARIVFIDDIPANVEGARKTGIQAVQFTGVARLRSDLAALGVEAG
ncbi:MAG: HAD family phosphatase [SAR202 cluster bacterium]|nr:HAD family phosphatase [SAR202 cluster bacterium]